MVAEHQADGTQTVVVVEELADDKYWQIAVHVSRLHERVLAVARPHWSEQNVAGSRKRTADDDHPWIEQCTDRRHPPTGDISRILDQPAQTDIPANASWTRLDNVRLSPLRRSATLISCAPPHSSSRQPRLPQLHRSPCARSPDHHRCLARARQRAARRRSQPALEREKSPLL